MGKANHKLVRWATGVTLETEQTRRWTPDEIEANNRHERRMVYSNFSPLDQGQGRRLVAICEREEDARRIVACVNACDGINLVEIQRLLDESPNAVIKIQEQRDELLEALQRIVRFVEIEDAHLANFGEVEAARAAIAKALGE